MTGMNTPAWASELDGNGPNPVKLGYHEIASLRGRNA